MKYYAGKVNKNNEFRIFIYHIQNGKLIRVGTKLSVTEKQFNPKTNKPLTESLQAVLDGWKSKIQS